MMQASENILCSVGCPKINLQVRDANKVVIEFYESIGYVAENIVKMEKCLEHDEPYRVD
jgi:ribosomal protein S18 acetylase RimI-like enzyme